MFYFIFSLFTFLLILAFNNPYPWGILLVLVGFMIMLIFVEDLEKNEIQ